jgi:DNA-binding SARP family transcriptional activator
LAVQRRADLRLEAGQVDRVIAELRELTGRHPLREPLWVQLLRALAAAGRPAEAITEYHRAPEGDAASGNGPARGVLRRLPADTGVFTGRQAELVRLLELGEGGDSGLGPGAVVIWALA